MLASFILLTFLINFHLDEACFITNCPPGGKRSHGDIDHMRECLRCGPGGCFNDLTCENGTPTADESLQRIFDSQSSHKITV
ncbi:conopressin/neurophysin-like isoform X2 [Panonychus citri]|uniref:conopressin/neurophysin-like isoform X2 n=1 Tax=Panonychus citri TaxID=50023 RepID=UPI0023079777|nr:conopressin/neurophysin-like isoform X2 [Panonychus citri]